MSYFGIKYEREYDLDYILNKLEGNIGRDAVVPICKRKNG